MMSEMLCHEFLTKISVTTLSIAVHNLGWVFLVVYPPVCGYTLVPWLSSSSGAVVVLIPLIQ